jgi:hypothetical protein
MSASSEKLIEGSIIKYQEKRVKDMIRSAVIIDDLIVVMIKITMIKQTT